MFSIANSVVSSKSAGSAPQPFMQDGSAADPASIGVAVLIANWTGQGNGQVDYSDRARQQVDYLFSSAVPKTADGAISHRVDSLQLW